MDRVKQAQAEGQKYVHQDWPSWRYHESCPDGQIFQCAEDVPEGWVDHPRNIGKKPDAPAATEFEAGHVEDDNEHVAELMKLTHDQLVGVLEAANEDREEEIEFLPSWPKMKLAKTIVLNDAVPTDDENEE